MEVNISTNPHRRGECPHCKATLLVDALYCGKCGHSISHASNSRGFDNFITSEQESPWRCISPALGLWVALLAINGLLGLAGHLFDISSPFFDLGAQGISALFILILCFKDRKQIKPLLCRFGYRGLLSYVEIIGALIFLSIFMWLYFKIASIIGIEKLPNLEEFIDHNWSIWSAIALICIMPGIFEELAFRGYIMARLLKVSNNREALILQAAMFSILHMLPAVFISHFVIGIILGALRLRSKSIYPGILVHTGWNALVILIEAYQIGTIG